MGEWWFLGAFQWLETFPADQRPKRAAVYIMNNPVGTAWIGMSRPGYGIHGTPHPEDVGRTESHGCFRLANWDAEHLADLVSVGTLVVVGR